MRKRLRKRLEMQLLEIMRLLDHVAELYTYFFVTGQGEPKTDDLFTDLRLAVQNVRDYLDPGDLQ